MPSYLDLGYDNLGSKRMTPIIRQAPQEVRNSFKFGSLVADSAYIGSGDAVFKADENGIYLGNAKFASAPFSVDVNGNLIATLASIVGAITGGTIDIGGADTTSFHVDTDGNMWLGAAAYADAPFKVDKSGNMYASLATIIGAITGGTIDIGGADATSFHVDVDGNMWLGNALLASAPFKVTNAGALTATGATISGAISGSTIDIGGADATSFHVDVDGNMWLGASTYAAAPSKISNAGALTAQSVTIKDSDGSNVVDSSGLVSTTQFPAASYSNTGIFSTTAESWADVTDLTLSFVLNRTQNVLIFGQILAYNDHGASSARTLSRTVVDTSTVIGSLGVHTATLGWISATAIEVVSLGAGTHTIKVQVYRITSDGNSKVDRENSSIGYVVLGK